MAFAELLQLVGNCGRYQSKLVFSTLALMMLVAAHNLVQNFSAAIPAHRCHVHLLDNITSQSKLPENLTAEALLRMSIPMDNNKQEQCRRFRQTQWQLLNSSNLTIDTTELEIEPCLDGWTYDQSLFTSTIVTQWDLVCKSQSLKFLSQSIYMTGYMLGSPIGGYIADKFGRRPVLLVSPLLVALLGTGSIFAPTFSIYCIIRFLLAMTLGSLYNITIVITLEWLPTNVIPTVMTARSLAISTGQVLLAGLAYVFRDWRMLQLSISVPYFVFFLFQWWSSESARWLILSGKLEKALKVMKKVAHINGIKDVEENLHIEVLRSAMKEELTFLKRSSKKTTNFLVYKIIFLLCFLRFSSIFFHFGLMTDLQNLGGNMFLSQALLGIVDFPSKFLSWFAMKFLPQRPLIASTLSLSGLCILINIFVPKDIPVVHLGLALLGKGFMAVYFSICGNFNHNLIPTGIRSKAEGMILFTMGLASSLGSLALITRQYFEHLPVILFGTFPIMAAICVYFLPETLNCPLPDTLQDVERRLLGKGSPCSLTYFASSETYLAYFNSTEDPWIAYKVNENKNHKKTSTNEEEISGLQDSTKC